MAVNFGPTPVTILAGTGTFGPVTVPDNVTTITMRIPTWPQPNRTLAAFVEISYDAGVTWEDLVRQNPWPGGNTVVGRDGTTDSTVVVGPMRPGTNRRLRVSLTAVGGSISTTLTVSSS